MDSLPQSETKHRVSEREADMMDYLAMAGWSQRKIAARIGRDPRTVSRILADAADSAAPDAVLVRLKFALHQLSEVMDAGEAGSELWMRQMDRQCKLAQQIRLREAALAREKRLARTDPQEEVLTYSENAERNLQALLLDFNKRRFAEHIAKTEVQMKLQEMITARGAGTGTDADADEAFVMQVMDETEWIPKRTEIDRPDEPFAWEAACGVPYGVDRPDDYGRVRVTD